MAAMWRRSSSRGSGVVAEHGVACGSRAIASEAVLHGPGAEAPAAIRGAFDVHALMIQAAGTLVRLIEPAGFRTRVQYYWFSVSSFRLFVSRARVSAGVDSLEVGRWADQAARERVSADSFKKAASARRCQLRNGERNDRSFKWCFWSALRNGGRCGNARRCFGRSCSVVVHDSSAAGPDKFKSRHVCLWRSSGRVL